MKRFRWFWSYRIQSTERWLESMARKGFVLKDMNRFTRLFTFEKTIPSKTTYSIQYRLGNLSDSLKRAGWCEQFQVGKWNILNNEASKVTYYPSNDNLFKRIRLHAYLFLVVSIFYLSTSPVLWLIFNSFDNGNRNYVAIIAPLLILLLLAGLTTFIFVSYRTFEKNAFNLNEEVTSRSKKIRKIRLAWMYQPLQTKKWLDEMHDKGYELDHVFATVFSFVPTKHPKIAYEITFEPKLKSDYYTLHKEIGWKLKYTSNMSLLNYSIWAMPYEETESTPAFSYDVSEKRKQIKKAFRMNMTITILILLLCAQSMYIQWGLITSNSIFTNILKYFLTIMTILWIILSIKIINGYKQELKILKES